jgi:aryl-alcohol dehydrogenase-like predicted oxidoreductase
VPRDTPAAARISLTARSPKDRAASSSAVAVSEHQYAVAALVKEVAAGLGATPAQVAIAWTRSRSPVICPIIGARRLDQLRDNLRAADLVLPAEAAERLDEATRIDLGFPAGFIRDNTAWVFGAAALTAPGRRTR